MGWADSCDDLNYPAPRGVEWLHRAEAQFRLAAARATARAEARAKARGAPLRGYATTRALSLPCGMDPRDLPIEKLARWRRVLDEAIPVTVEEVISSLDAVGFVLERIAYETLRESLRSCEIVHLLDAEDIVGLSIDGHQLGVQFEFSVALVDEVAKLGMTYWLWDGDTRHDVTPRFVALAANLGV